VKIIPLRLEGDVSGAANRYDSTFHVLLLGGLYIDLEGGRRTRQSSPRIRSLIKKASVGPSVLQAAEALRCYARDQMFFDGSRTYTKRSAIPSPNSFHSHLSLLVVLITGQGCDCCGLCAHFWNG
jgi:hypothetical protein